MSTTARALMAMGFGGLGILLALGQVVVLIAARRRQSGYSLVPFVGAILGVAACLVAPWSGSAWFLPLAFVLDPSPVVLLWVAATGGFKRRDG